MSKEQKMALRAQDTKQKPTKKKPRKEYHAIGLHPSSVKWRHEKMEAATPRGVVEEYIRKHLVPEQEGLPWEQAIKERGPLLSQWKDEVFVVAVFDPLRKSVPTGGRPRKVDGKCTFYATLVYQRKLAENDSCLALFPPTDMDCCGCSGTNGNKITDSKTLVDSYDFKIAWGHVEQRLEKTKKRLQESVISESSSSE